MRYSIRGNSYPGGLICEGIAGLVLVGQLYLRFRKETFICGQIGTLERAIDMFPRPLEGHRKDCAADVAVSDVFPEVLFDENSLP